MLWRQAPLVAMLNQFRVAWLMGGYGSGKTLLAYSLAWELYKSGRYRYILGNSSSVWTDSPENVVLRDGSYVDAVVILDEGGLFMRVSRDADQFMLGLRKLNITIIVPSVLPPSQRIKFLQVQRVLNGQVIGLPAWIYEYRLSIGSEHEKSWMALIKPSEMYGIYDTMDYPIDDLYMSDWFDYWMGVAISKRPAWADWGAPKGPGLRSTKRSAWTEGEDQRLDEIGGKLDELQDIQGAQQDAISLLAGQSGEKRGRKWL